MGTRKNNSAKYFRQARDLGAYGQVGRQLMGALGQRRENRLLRKDPTSAHLTHSLQQTLRSDRDES